MKPDFIDRAAKIITEVRTRTSIDTIDAEVIEELLQDELKEYYNEVFTYARNIGYDEGYSDKEAYTQDAVESAYYEGYDDGLNEAVAIEEAAYYSRGFAEGRAKAESDNKAYTQEAIVRAYYEGYDDGYAAGYKRGVNDTIGEVQNQSWKKIKMNRTKLTDKRLIEVVKEVLGTHYFKSDEDFLKQALENYYYGALNRKEFAREFVANGYCGGVTETYWFTYWYVLNIIQLLK